MNAPLLHIIVVLYNSSEAFTTLWQHLQAQSCRDWRLIAIDNASADGSLDTLRSLSDPRLTIQANDANVGFSRAVNQGLRISAQQGAQRCMLLNPDTVLPPGFLQDLIDAWQEHGWAVVAPRVMLLEDPAQSWYAGGHLDYGWKFGNHHEIYKPAEPQVPRVVDFASGCCLGVTVEALERIGLLDESFFVYWEDVDFCMRLTAANIPIHYLPDPMLLHEGGASSGGEKSPAATRLYHVGYMLLLRKHFGLAAALRTMYRTLWWERRERGDQPGHVRTVALAMLRGLRAPLLPVPRLQPAAPRSTAPARQP